MPPLLILAADHRDAFEARYGGDDVAIRDAKALVVDGACAAATRCQEALQQGLLGGLVDEQYAASAIPKLRDVGFRVGVPVEAGGTSELAFAYGDDFRSHIEAVRPDFAKLLVRWSPGDDEGRKKRQGKLLWNLQAVLDVLSIPLMLELVVLEAGSRELERASFTIAAMTEIRARGIAPSVWKLEPQGAAEDYERVAKFASRVPCVLLGAGRPLSELAAHVRLAIQGGWRGFAVGRSIWGQPLDAYAGGSDRASCVEEIATGFKSMVDASVAAESSASSSSSSVSLAGSQ